MKFCLLCTEVHQDIWSSNNTSRNNEIDGKFIFACDEIQLWNVFLFFLMHLALKTNIYV